jgi:hypothetical protein
MARVPIANLKGPKGETGPRGLPGVNAVENDEAVATYVREDDTATHAAVLEVAAAKEVQDTVETGRLSPSQISAAIYGAVAPAIDAILDGPEVAEKIETAVESVVITSEGGVIPEAEDNTVRLGWDEPTTVYPSIYPGTYPVSTAYPVWEYVPRLDDEGRIPLALMPNGYAPGGGAVAVPMSIATGFTPTAWGQFPAAYSAGEAVFLSGQIAAGAADIEPGVLLATAAPGVWAADKRVTVQTPTGVVLLLTTATGLVVEQILSGGSAPWVNLDGAVIASAG